MGSSAQAQSLFPMCLTINNSRCMFASCNPHPGNQNLFSNKGALRLKGVLPYDRSHFEAARIADEGVRALIETSRVGVSEYEIHQAVEKAMFDAGGDNPWSVILRVHALWSHT